LRRRETNRPLAVGAIIFAVVIALISLSARRQSNTYQPPTFVFPTLVPTPTLSGRELEDTQVAITQDAESTEIAHQAEMTATAVKHQQDIDATQAVLDTRATQAAMAQLAAQTMEAAQGTWPLLTKVDPANPFHDWPTGDISGGGLLVTATISTTQYVWNVAPKASGGFLAVTPTINPKVTDFYAKVDLQFVAGDSAGGFIYGLVFRKKGSDLGFFGLSNDGYWHTYNVTGFTTAINEGPNSAILTKPGDVNHLLVRSIDNSFVFSVNDAVIASWDADFQDGTVGLGAEVERQGNPAQVQFGNFEVHVPAP
jgi:hypothetical protein